MSHRRRVASADWVTSELKSALVCGDGREILSDLARLGFHLKALEAFVESTYGMDAIFGMGLYRHALASGLTGESTRQVSSIKSVHKDIAKGA